MKPITLILPTYSNEPGLVASHVFLDLDEPTILDMLSKIDMVKELKKKDNHFISARTSSLNDLLEFNMGGLLGTLKGKYENKYPDFIELFYNDDQKGIIVYTEALNEMSIQDFWTAYDKGDVDPIDWIETIIYSSSIGWEFSTKYSNISGDIKEVDEIMLKALITTPIENLDTSDEFASWIII